MNELVMHGMRFVRQDDGSIVVYIDDTHVVMSREDVVKLRAFFYEKRAESGTEYRCPCCYSSAKKVSCVKCMREMCEDCFSVGAMGEMCGLCIDRE